jgi:uncharacterized protein YbbC (DUF1343 family)
LDRPNPLGGVLVDGPLPEAHLSSLVGRFPVPVCHGLTLGELTWMVNETWNPSLAKLSIVPCQGWERAMRWEDTRLQWVPPSPSAPHYDPPVSGVSGWGRLSGGGDSLPFEIVGAPWIEGMRLAEVLNGQDWAEVFGVRFRPHTFEPTFSKHAGARCEGIQVHIVDKGSWRAIPVWLGLIATVALMYPEEFRWLKPHPGGVAISTG